ncbi:hypothetical protein [Rahnella sp. ChDrAdgB13]|uniref:hypothetical protein n=1 Tax=Rahnella sp. ChDrAdgB13 TaxID=1850581 RepID=UPI001AD88B31|nr:hypothetical protein [Rahnella sp. ChDrAdgB13]
MSITVSSIQKKAVALLVGSPVIAAIVEQIYTAPAEDEINSAVTEFVGHLTLSDEDTVRQTCGDNFDVIAAAFAEQSGVVAKALAEQVAADAKADFTAEVQAYADHLQYKHSEDNGQNVTAGK